MNPQETYSTRASLEELDAEIARQERSAYTSGLMLEHRVQEDAQRIERNARWAKTALLGAKRLGKGSVKYGGKAIIVPLKWTGKALKYGGKALKVGYRMADKMIDNEATRQANKQIYEELAAMPYFSGSRPNSRRVYSRVVGEGESKENYASVNPRANDVIDAEFEPSSDVTSSNKPEPEYSI